MPASPRRIVTLDPFYSLLMVGELGVPVRGTTISGDGLPKAAHVLFDELPVVVGQMTAPNLEAILSLQPDLIVGDAFNQAELRVQLEGLAPTALIDSRDWKTYFRTVAHVVGALGVADAKLAEYDRVVRETSANLPDDVTVSFLRIVPGGFQVYVSGPAAYASARVLEDLDLVRPEFETVHDDTVLKRPTMEGLLELQGDILIYTIGGAHHDGDADALEREVTSNPIWQAIPAVRSGNAHRVDPEHWMGFGGLHSAHAIIADVRRIFDPEAP